MKDYGCRWRGVPHDLYIRGETSVIKVEGCRLCRKTFRWPKWFKGRTDNVRYLKAHARNFCQKCGATHRLFMQLYEPTRCIIEI